PERRLAPFAESSGHVPTAPGDQAEQDGLEAGPVRYPGSVTTEWMVGFAPFGQIGGKGRPDGVDDDRVKCKHGTSTGSLGWDKQPDHVRSDTATGGPFFLVMGGPPPSD